MKKVRSLSLLIVRAELLGFDLLQAVVVRRPGEKISAVIRFRGISACRVIAAQCHPEQNNSMIRP